MEALARLTNIKINTATKVLLGALFLAACAQITIPLYPVPMTMQTLGIFALAVMQGGKKASYSTLLYLVLATLGLPVLPGGAIITSWLALPTVGYLVAFPIAAFVIGKMVQIKERPSSLWIVASIFVGQAIIYTLGIFGLMQFLSLKQSIMVGVVPFLPLAGAKALFAAGLGGAWLRFRKAP
ncbi:biotin transporter BioY [Candidatus Neptunochlamydia vexilliferae]|uniref:biotin transporter BioY n=1 Tax=Candidatus Neptunichlamydia vexilliferae TaxID=1651774 RepID=UPI001890D02B|nr:biotin transporter BioY [Candidatus Neptunochlamydia vexilliferae]